MEPLDASEPVALSDGDAWTPRVERLLHDWRKRVYAAQSAHYASADLFRKLNYIVGIPTIIFSTVVGTAIFAGLEKNSPRAPLVAFASIFAAVWRACRHSFDFPNALHSMRLPATGTPQFGAT